MYAYNTRTHTLTLIKNIYTHIIYTCACRRYRYWLCSIFYRRPTDDHNVQYIRILYRCTATTKASLDENISRRRAIFFLAFIRTIGRYIQKRFELHRQSEIKRMAATARCRVTLYNISIAVYARIPT